MIKYNCPFGCKNYDPHCEGCQEVLDNMDELDSNYYDGQDDGDSFLEDEEFDNSKDLEFDDDFEESEETFFFDNEK